MKIYTKTGDQGKTSLIGGTRLPKHHLRIHAYGTVDELNAQIGLLRDHLKNENHIKNLLEVQDRLFTIGAILASDPEKSKMKIPELIASDVEFLEKEIDRMTAVLPEMKSFILPGGHPAVSFCHVARCICRKAERYVCALAEESKVPGLVIIYLNRLSDYLFTLARMISMELGAEEVPWKARM